LGVVAGTVGVAYGGGGVPGWFGRILREWTSRISRFGFGWRCLLRVRLAMFIALTLVGGGIAVVTDVGHILAFAPLAALALTNLVDWLYRRRARRQRIQAPPAATL